LFSLVVFSGGWIVWFGLFRSEKYIFERKKEKKHTERQDSNALHILFSNFLNITMPKVLSILLENQQGSRKNRSIYTKTALLSIKSVDPKAFHQCSYSAYYVSQCTRFR